MLQKAPKTGLRKDEIAKAFGMTVMQATPLLTQLRLQNVVNISESKHFGNKATIYGSVTLFVESTPEYHRPYSVLSIDWMDVVRADGEAHKACPSLRNGIRHEYKPPMSGMSSQVRGGFL